MHRMLTSWGACRLSCYLNSTVISNLLYQAPKFLISVHRFDIVTRLCSSRLKSSSMVKNWVLTKYPNVELGGGCPSDGNTYGFLQLGGHVCQRVIRISPERKPLLSIGTVVFLFAIL